MTGWHEVLPRVFLWPDSCNVYAVAGPSGSLVVNAGTGTWIDYVSELPTPPVAIACTHFFRDHSAGAARAARELGVRVLVPEREAALFADPLEHFRARPTYNVYDNYWDHFAPIEPIPVGGVLLDDERIDVGGKTFEVIPLPGATINQVGLAFTSDCGLRVVCSGETIHSPGRLPRVAPLQYHYKDLSGAVEVWHSAGGLRRRGVDVLLPSLGTPILENADGALTQLQRSIEAACATRPLESANLVEDPLPSLQRLSDHVWLARRSFSSSTFVVNDRGEALAIDYGYHALRAWQAAGMSPPVYRTRPLAHTLDALRDRAGVERIDVVVPSHYHDDHVAGVPLLQRTQQTKCWAHEVFAELLAQPDAHRFPCDNPYPVRVDRAVTDQETATWGSVDFRFRAASGHTRFEALIGFEVDGVRYAHAGDQYGFITRASFESHESRDPAGDWISDWTSVVLMNNHVYRGGAALDSFTRSAAWLRRWHPDIVLSGHWPPFRTDASFFDLLDEAGRRFEASHRRLMPLEPDEAHFDADSWAGWLWPYRIHLSPGEQAVVRATVRNPYPHDATLQVRLVGPDGWCGSEAALRAGGRAEVSCELRITPDGPCRRQPIAIELVADGQPFGQVAEALVTVGGVAW